MEMIDEAGQVIGLRRYNLSDAAIRKRIFRYSPFCHPAVVMRKAVLERAGLYRHEFNPAEDYELYFRLGQHARLANLDDVVLRYRVVRGTSMTTAGTRRLERLTIAVRQLYSDREPYRMGALDRLYNMLHLWSLYLVPSALKRWMFAKLRNA